MLLSKIILNNYGVYRGGNEFNLTCSKDKPIILIGGTNGAGKTTLFESVMLCLYGISIMGKHVTKKTYEQFIEKKIHKYAKSADSASIIVQFKFFHNGDEVEYKVNRNWQKNGTKIIEHLSIHKRNSEQNEFEPLEDIEESQWQSFIEDIVPKGVAMLFFFDGEKIVRIAEEQTEDMTIKDSLQSLLGLDVVEQLRSDLQINMVRNLTHGRTSLQDEYDKLRAEKENNLANNTRLRERLAQKQNELDALSHDIESLESQISKIGGIFTSKRDAAKTEITVKRASADSIKKRLQEQCAGIMPFSLIPNLLEDIAKQIEQDNLIMQKNAGHSILRSKIAEINSAIASDKLWQELRVGHDVAKKIHHKISSLLEQKITMQSDDSTEMFGLSTIQSSRILGIIHDSNSSALNTFETDTKQLIKIEEEVENLDKIIVNAAADDEVGPLITQLGRLHHDVGELNSEMTYIEEKIVGNTAMLKQIDSKMRGIISDMYEDEKSQVKVVLTKNVQTVLEEFVGKLRTKKLKRLEGYLLEALDALLHKQNFIDRVSVNPDTFVIDLYNKDGRLVPKELLSKGEKQMFATALLWALAKTSGRPLPFMIDTPLARLDTDHRTNIVKKFLPLASHQVLIFSTDTEIEYDYYSMLKPYVSRSYVMDFMPKVGATAIRENYFWNEKGEKIVAV